MKDWIALEDEIDADVRALVQGVREAGRALADFWPSGTIRKPFQKYLKEDGSWVTDADYAANRILCEVIATIYPDTLVRSEEGEPFPESPILEECIILDPLDGTHAFIDGKDDFSTLVGVVKGGQPQKGIMYFPVRELLGVGIAGKGAWINGTKVRCSQRRVLEPARCYLRKCPEFDDPRVEHDTLDSGLALLEVTQGGRFDAVVIRMITHREWDIAGPAALIREAGGLLTDEKGQEIQFGFEGKPPYKYFIASNGWVHDEVLVLVDAMITGAAA